MNNHLIAIHHERHDLIERLKDLDQQEHALLITTEYDNDAFSNNSSSSFLADQRPVAGFDISDHLHIPCDQKECRPQKRTMSGNKALVATSTLTDSTQRLVDELWNAPQHALEHEVIKALVMFDDNANPGALRKAICVARKELKEKHSVFKITTIRKHGHQSGKYQLVRISTLPQTTEETLPNVTERSKNTEKTAKQKGNVR